MTTKSKLISVAVSVASVIALGHFFAKPTLAVVAALVRDIDTPALAPFTGTASFNLTSLNTQQLITTVPAGKRLVITDFSYESGGDGAAQLVFIALRKGSLGQLVQVFGVNPPHASVTPGLTLQDGNQPCVTYFEAGDDVVISASYTGAGSRDMNVYVSGYFVTP